MNIKKIIKNYKNSYYDKIISLGEQAVCLDENNNLVTHSTYGEGYGVDELTIVIAPNEKFPTVNFMIKGRDDYSYFEHEEIMDMMNEKTHIVKYDENQKGFVYLLYDKKRIMYKIGISCNVDRRKGELEKEYNTEIDIVHKVYSRDMNFLEKKLHKYFYKYVTFKKEWFAFSSIQISECVKMMNEDPDTIEEEIKKEETSENQTSE